MFQWTSFLTIAKELAERDDEGYRRAAIGRAYFCAFGVACDWLRTQDATEQQLRSHKFVWGEFKHQADSDAVAWLKGRDAYTDGMNVWQAVESLLAAEAGSPENHLASVKHLVYEEGDSLKDARHRADYKKRPVTKRHVEKAIKQAEELLRLLDRLKELSSRE